MAAPAEKDSYQTALRLIETLRLMPRHPRALTVRELKDRLEARGFAVDARTIQRNLNLLSEHYPLHGDEARPQR
jgi:predicted DNA-binding transcriptional regulator YafY